MSLRNLIKKFFSPQPQQIVLGRWRLKHNHQSCEEYLRNYHGDPGYPNLDKDIWIEKYKDKSESETNVFSKNNSI
jgi:hypothetical protein